MLDEHTAPGSVNGGSPRSHRRASRSPSDDEEESRRIAASDRLIAVDALGGVVDSEDVAVAAYVPINESLRDLEQATFMISSYGILQMLLCWVIVLVVHVAGVERFEAPPADKVKMLVLNAVLDATYNSLLLFGIIVTSPLFMSIGVMLVMPVSIVVDRIQNGTKLEPGAVIGAVIIVGAFTLLNLPAGSVTRLWRRRCRCTPPPRKDSSGSVHVDEAAPLTP
jgi:hypothetical protein